ncbi:MAG: siderophore-interacting protein [Polyangiales bacterium]
MSSAKALLGGILGRYLFRDAQVTQVIDVGPSLRRIVLRGEALRDVAWRPGDKLEVFLPEVGMRAYTPLRWDRDAGETELFVYLHGESPGASWARGLRGDERVQVFGPRRSLSVAEGAGVVLFGDETSLGLLHALALGPPARAVTAVLEVGRPDEVRAAVAALGLTATLIARAPDDGHLDAVRDVIARAREAQPEAALVMSGRARGIQALRRALRTAPWAAIATKAYWSPGKVGLD